jgi:GxxExxY protein
MKRDPLVYAVIGHAMATHKEIGPGVNEEIYHRLMAQRLTAEGIEHRFKPRGILKHRGISADVFEPDFVLPDRLVPELKVRTGHFLPDHFWQLKSYLKFHRIRHGLLFDFGKESLATRSYLFDDCPPLVPDPRRLMAAAPRSVDTGRALPLLESLLRIIAAHGFGYRDTTYCRLLVADLTAEGMQPLSRPTVPVPINGTVIGRTELGCVHVPDHAAVLVLSQREAIRAADRAILQTALRLLTLPWGMIAHFDKHELQIQWVLKS